MAPGFQGTTGNSDYIIPKSYSSILKFFDLDKLKSKKICSVCSNELAAKQICENTHCKQAKL